MKLAFMGTPAFAVPALAALVAAGHDVVAVYTQPPRPAGRGQKLTPSPVQQWAEQNGIPVHTPISLKDAEVQARFAALGPDAAVVAAYGLLLPLPILEAPRLGCLNIHASLLPRWRGAAPIQRAILAGDMETGICIMRMERGLDTGPVYQQAVLPIGPDDTGQTLHDALAELGAQEIVAVLERINQLHPEPQPETGVTYAAKISKDELRLDWNQPAEQLARQVRAFHPSAWCLMNGERVKILSAQVEPGAGAPGTILDDKLLVACGEGALRLLTLQRAGRGAVTAPALLAGFTVRDVA